MKATLPRTTSKSLTLLLPCIAVLLASSPIQGAALFEYDFASGSGANTGTASGGTLAVSNSGTGGVTFGTTGGVGGGGVLNLTGNQTYNTSNAGYAAGTLTGLGTQTGVTVAMWVKFSAAALTSNARLFVLGASDVGAVGSVGLTLNGAAKLNVYVDGGSTADTINLGPTLSADTWYFIALTYDGTSSGSTNSTVQGAATTDGNTKNGQLYVGTATSAVTDSPVKIGLTSPNYNDSRGSIDFGASTALYLGNRADYTRGLNGMIDDVSIYSGVLSQTSLDTLRLESVPEPGVAALLAVGVGSLLFFRNRRRVLEDA